MTTGINNLNRPRMSDPDVIADAAKALLEYIKHPADDESIASIIRADNFSSGTFEMAKQLDSDGWLVDDEMLEALGEFWAMKHAALRVKVREWVSSNVITAQYAIGEKVIVQKDGHRVIACDAQSPDAAEGTIVDVHDQDGEYVICVPAFGHKQPFAEGVGANGVVLPFELFPQHIRQTELVL